MRAAILFTAFLLLIPAALAATSTGMQGTQPAAYGDIVAFVTSEDAVNEDLNNDGDQADKVVQYYSLREGKVTNIGSEGSHPSAFGKLIAFEDKSRLVQLWNIDEKTLNEINVRGTTPSIYSKDVAFATSEQDAGIDLNEDNDAIDSLIRHFDTGSDTTTNFKAVGESPVALGDFIVFSTREDKLEDDLNKDGDLDDSIIRTIELGTGTVINTRVTGSNPAGYKHKTIIITDDKKLWALNLETSEKKYTGISGNDPAVYQDLLVYERDGKLWLYRLSTSVEKALDIAGKDPAIFDDFIAFVDEKNEISVLQGTDADKDDVPDFADNCPDKDNADQVDKDKDGIGDYCDKDVTDPPAEPVPEEPKAPAATAKVTEPLDDKIFTTQEPAAEPVPVAPAERKQMPETMTLQKKPDDSRGPAYWFLVAVGIVVIGILVYFFVPKWLQRRKKSYGF